MVNKKHQLHLNDIFFYIYNRLTVGITVEDVCDEVVEKFHFELAMYEVSPNMIHNFVRELCLQAYLYITKRIYDPNDAQQNIGGTNA